MSLAMVIIKTLATIGNNETNQSSVCESLTACVTGCLMSSFPILITSGLCGDTDIAITMETEQELGDRQGGLHVLGLKALVGI